MTAVYCGHEDHRPQFHFMKLGLQHEKKLGYVHISVKCNGNTSDEA